MEAKKFVLKLHVYDEKAKQKALKKIAGLEGIESIAMDMGDKKLTVIGHVDPVEVVEKLRKHWNTEVLTVGPSKEPEKKPNNDAATNKPEAGTQIFGSQKNSFKLTRGCPESHNFWIELPHFKLSPTLSELPSHFPWTPFIFKYNIG